MVKEERKGITLISLVITIVLLLILAGVAITLATDSNGLFSKAGEATDKWNDQVAKEEQTLADLIAELENLDSTENTPNRPKLVDGMTPIKFTLPEGNTAGSTVTTTAGDADWYDYDAKHWANAQTEDGSMWVWIPRYAYKINSETQTTEVVFLRGTSDNYYDEEGNIQTAKRAKTVTDEINTAEGFTVHPAFTNESSIGYRNGGWDKELTGIWVAKFEAGYASGNNTAPVAASNVKYSQATVYARAVETGDTDKNIPARNWLDGIYETANTTAIKYPTFQPLTYSMNYMNHSDAYLLVQDMTGENNIYGFTRNTADTHLMKNSEWGAISYLSQSKYGLNGTDIAVNNVNMNSGGNSTTKVEGNAYASVYGITGVTKGSATAGEYQVQSYSEVTAQATNNTATTTDSIYKWNQTDGQKASSSGNMYGIYDLSGALYERTTGYVANGRSNLKSYGSSFTWDGSSYIMTSTKYSTVYPHNTESDNTTITDASGESTKLNVASTANYAENTLIYGDAIRETSTAGTGKTSWYSDYSYFTGLIAPFSLRGGYLWGGQGAGLFSFGRNDGNSNYDNGFRSVVVAE